MKPRKILVTGATGYIGGRLVPRLLDQGYQVRCLVRDPDRLRHRSWEDQVEIVAGDVLAYRDMFRRYARVRGLNDPRCAGAHAAPVLALGGSGYAGQQQDRPPAHRGSRRRGRRPGRDGAAPLRRRLAQLRGSRAPGARPLRPRRRRDDVERGRLVEHRRRGDDQDAGKGGRADPGTFADQGAGRSGGRLPGDKEPWGDTGWLYANTLWKIRGFMDLLVGGIGLRKSRRSYTNVREGDTIDFWRVEAVEENRLLRLRAEMKLPGKAWLQYTVQPTDADGSLVTQTAYYEPKGLAGLLYWHVFSIPHRLIFPGMLRELGRRAEALGVTEAVQ